MKKKFQLKTKLYRWSGDTAAWYFLTVPKQESSIIKNEVKTKRGFGSIRVSANIGKSTWDTSIFPAKEGVYLLPVKASIRRAEGIDDGDVVSYVLSLRA